MCGIAGVVHLNGQEPVLREQVEGMTATLFHRGPDDDGFFVDECVGLGMRRLNVIDLAGGSQPIFNESGRVCVVFNGEIYNYRELRRRLESRGHVFSTDTDTEVIVHQYEEDGDSCVEHFVGMFAFALWDAERRRLLLARDRFGVKPLYVAESGTTLAFASEIKALRTLGWVDTTWNAAGLAAYLSLNFTPGDLTAFRGVRKLSPATTEAWTCAGARPRASRRAYWAPRSARLDGPPPTLAAARARVRELLRDSVGLRLRSDVPLGAFLSGGIDSSCVVALMKQCGAPDIRTFSIGFEDSKYDESVFASAVATTLGTAHRSMTVTGGDARELLGVLATFDDPFGDASAIPTYFVSRLARESVTVALSGDGGDELFAGYDHYRRLGAYRAWDSLPLAFRRASSHLGASILREDQRGGGLVRRLGAPRDLRLLSLVSRSPQGLVQGALSQGFREFVTSGIDATWQDAYRLQGSLEDARFVDQERFLVDDVMVKVDRASMAVSLEAREPLLDHRLADYVNALPLTFHHDGKVGKLLLRDFLAGVVPASIMNRPKMGFAPPVRQWLLGPLRDRTMRLLLDLCPMAFDALGVRRLFEALELDRRSFDSAVWNLLCLAVWIEAQPDVSLPF